MLPGETVLGDFRGEQRLKTTPEGNAAQTEETKNSNNCPLRAGVVVFKGICSRRLIFPGM